MATTLWCSLRQAQGAVDGLVQVADFVEAETSQF